MPRRFAAVLTAVVAFAACTSKADVNGPGVTGTADITGNWAGHGDGQESFDSITVSFTQTGTTVGGGGVYWLDQTRKPIKVSGARVNDSLAVALPDSTGSPKDTLQFAASITKDSFGDEIFGSIGVNTPANGITFTLHRRP